jgi:hypothetical protein
MTATPSKSKTAHAVIRAIGYVRLSTGEQGESGLGLKAQVVSDPLSLQAAGLGGGGNPGRGEVGCEGRQ